MADSDEKRTVQETFRHAWLALTGALSSAESEVQKRLYDALGVPPDANLAEELRNRMRRNREELERRVDEGVRAAVAKVRAPIDRELATLRQRLERLQEKVEERRRAREQTPKE